MKKVFSHILLVIGILLVAVFFIAAVYDYYALNVNMFVSYRYQDSVVLSAILFLVPGIACLIAVYILKKK